jgi:hypothetical protein
MTRTTALIIAVIASLCRTAAATSPPVTFESPCECRDVHGKARLAVKNDPSTPPADASAIQAVTPSDVYSCPGPDVQLTGRSKRTGIENKWYALTGRVVAVKRTVIYILRFKMRLAINRGSSLLKYRQNHSGVRFAARFSVGRRRDSRFTPAPVRS